jgi:uncharacterized membrane protein
MTTTDSPAPAPAPVAEPRRRAAAGFLLGFAMGGFFDGILLHQILQWHHLLSAVEGAPFDDVAVQVLADGAFHAAMYALAAAGLWLLWRRPAGTGGPRPGGDRALLGDFVLGFGAWHIVDAVVSHWLLGIHHVRMDSDRVLLWDLGFLAFGIACSAAGIALRRPPRSPGPGPRPRGAATAALLSATVVAAGAVAARPAADASAVTAWFGPGATAEAAFAAAGALDGRVVASDPSGRVWVLALPAGTGPAALYRHGALLVGGSIPALGCFGSGAT